MSQTNTITFEATLRDRAGKGTARAIRREGRVPAVIYGDKKEPVMISIPANELQKVLNRGGLLTNITEINVGKDTHKVLARDIQFHPVQDSAEHVDFLRVTDKTKLNVSVGVNFLNEDKAPGLKAGGIINVVRHSLDVACSATSIPESIDFDLDGLGIGDSLHMQDAILPKGTTLPTDDNFTVAAIIAPSAVASAANEETTDAEEATEEAPAEE